MKILLVDDDIEIGILARNHLSPYEVTQAYSVADARTALKTTPFDLLIIDVILPDGSGFDLCSSLSTDANYSSAPIIILSSKANSSEVVYGLSCGADDYITKPFNGAILKARVDAKLRKMQGARTNTGRLIFGGIFEFDCEFQRCFLSEEGRETVDLLLTPTEFRIFLSLAKENGQLLSRRRICDAVWHSLGAYVDPRGINTHIAHLRKKLGQHGDAIVSVYGRGYAFQRPRQIALPTIDDLTPTE